MQRFSGNSCGGLSSRGCLHTVCGFTLIELLVVVAIISLLVSLLVPAMEKARGAAQQSQCLANQHGIALAMCMYLDSFNGYLPGSPNTSGAGPQQPVPDTKVATNAFDWASPLLGFLNMSVPANRARRQELTRLGVFKCPANNYQFEPWTDSPATPDTSDFTTSQAASYLTCWNFLLAGDNYARAQIVPELEYWVTGANWSEILPKKYLPKITKIGSPAQKIFLADAARYIDEAGNYTYDTSYGYSPEGSRSYNIYGYGLWGAGSYSGSGAWWIDSREYGDNQPAADYSYRHDNGIAAAFYDGHGEYLKREESHRARYWYPKGTVLTDGSDGAGGEPSGYVVP